ncbi:MAG: capsule assembly Wzi family protein [Candidatus Zixiibacteriota bacterium]
MKKFLSTFPAPALALLVSSSTVAQIAPSGELDTDLYYKWRQREKARSPGGFDYQLAPYVIDTDSLNGSLFPYWSASPNSLRWYAAPGESFLSQRSRRSSAQERLRGGMSVALSSRVFAQSSFVVDESLADDPLYTGKIWRGLAGDVETAVMSYSSEKLTALFGRFRGAWGPALTNTLLSQEARPLDGLSFRYRLSGKFTFSYQLARLDGLSPDDPNDTLSVFVKRYFAAHRIDLRPHHSLRLGVFESVIFAGPGRGLELQFLNPLIFFHANQLNEANNDNTFLGFDFDWWPGARFNLYGQLLVDDFQIEKKTQGDQEPNEIGWIVGAHLVDMRPGWDVRFQWDRVTNRTYNQKLPRNRYLNQNQPLGHPLGNDFELFQAHLSRWWGATRMLRFSGLWRRSGEGGVRKPWTEPWLQVSGAYSEPFPSGVVERQATVQLELQTLVPRSESSLSNSNSRFKLRATVGWSDFANEGNIPGADRSGLFANVGVTFFIAGDWRLD